MKIKLLAIDMDGTLLYSKHEITPRVKEAVVAAASMGIKVVLSTGRIYASARYYTRLMGIDMPIITCNGALIKEDNRVIYTCPIPKDTIVEVLSKLKKYDRVYYQMYTENTYYAKEENEMVNEYLTWNEKQNQNDKITIKIMDNPMDMLNEPEELLKLYIVKGKDEQYFNQFVGEMNDVKGVYCVSSLSNSVDVINSNVNKGAALSFIANEYGIDRESVLAIGDNYNDIEMIKYAGIGVAMANAEESVRAVADYVTKSNLEDGVAVAIEKFILQS